MILRRGVGAIVPAGAPYFPRQAPLVPTIINTIAGREFEGGRYGVTANPFGTNPVRKGSRMRRRGMGDVQYCANNPPSADQVAYLSSHGIAYSIVPCGGIPTPQGTNLGNQPLTPTTITPVAPVYTPIDTGVENCALQDTACIVAAAAKQTANQQAFYQAQADYNTRVCINAGGGGYVPSGTDPVSWCMNQYGGNPNSVNATSAPVAPAGVTPALFQTPLAAAAVSSSGGTLRFQNLTSGNNSSLQVGDKWRITITGATPNTQVSVTGGRNGQSSATPMGSTDSGGNFSQSGQITADQVGSWQESWSVGSAASGFIAFTVASPASSAPSLSSPASAGAATPGTSGGGGAALAPGTFDLTGFLTGSAFLGVPNWILLAAAAGAVVLLGGKR